MARFYNTTNGPVAFRDATGESCMIPPKSWLEVAADRDSSADIVALVQRGTLVRRDSPAPGAANLPSSKPLIRESKPFPKPAPAPAAAPKAVSRAMPVITVAKPPPKPEPKPEVKDAAPVVNVPATTVSAKDSEPAKPNG